MPLFRTNLDAGGGPDPGFPRGYLRSKRRAVRTPGAPRVNGANVKDQGSQLIKLSYKSSKIILRGASSSPSPRQLHYLPSQPSTRPKPGQRPRRKSAWAYTSGASLVDRLILGTEKNPSGSHEIFTPYDLVVLERANVSTIAAKQCVEKWAKEGHEFVSFDDIVYAIQLETMPAAEWPNFEQVILNQYKKLFALLADCRTSRLLDRRGREDLTMQDIAQLVDAGGAREYTLTHVKHLNGRRQDASLKELAAEIRDCHIKSSRREQFVREIFNCITVQNFTLFTVPIPVTLEGVDFILDGAKAGLETVAHLQALVLGGQQFASLQELVTSIAASSKALRIMQKQEREALHRFFATTAHDMLLSAGEDARPSIPLYQRVFTDAELQPLVSRAPDVPRRVTTLLHHLLTINDSGRQFLSTKGLGRALRTQHATFDSEARFLAERLTTEDARLCSLLPSSLPVMTEEAAGRVLEGSGCSSAQESVSILGMLHGIGARYREMPDLTSAMCSVRSKLDQCRENLLAYLNLESCRLLSDELRDESGYFDNAIASSIIRETNVNTLIAVRPGELLSDLRVAMVTEKNGDQLLSYLQQLDSDNRTFYNMPDLVAAISAEHARSQEELHKALDRVRWLLGVYSSDLLPQGFAVEELDEGSLIGTLLASRSFSSALFYLAELVLAGECFASLSELLSAIDVFYMSTLDSILTYLKCPYCNLLRIVDTSSPSDFDSAPLTMDIKIEQAALLFEVAGAQTLRTLYNLNSTDMQFDSMDQLLAAVKTSVLQESVKTDENRRRVLTLLTSDESFGEWGKDCTGADVEDLELASLAGPFALQHIQQLISSKHYFADMSDLVTHVRQVHVAMRQLLAECEEILTSPQTMLLSRALKLSLVRMDYEQLLLAGPDGLDGIGCDLVLHLEDIARSDEHFINLADLLSLLKARQRIVLDHRNELCERLRDYLEGDDCLLWAKEGKTASAPALTLDQLSQFMVAVGASHLVIAFHDLVSHAKQEHSHEYDVNEPSLVYTSTASLLLLIQHLHHLGKESLRFQPDATGVANLVALVRERHLLTFDLAHEMCEYLNGPECMLLGSAGGYGKVGQRINIVVTVQMAVQVYIETRAGPSIMKYLQRLDSEEQCFETVEDLTSAITTMQKKQQRAEDRAGQQIKDVHEYIMSDACNILRASLTAQLREVARDLSQELDRAGGEDAEEVMTTPWDMDDARWLYEELGLDMDTVAALRLLISEEGDSAFPIQQLVELLQRRTANIRVERFKDRELIAQFISSSECILFEAADAGKAGKDVFVKVVLSDLDYFVLVGGGIDATMQQLRVLNVSGKKFLDMAGLLSAFLGLQDPQEEERRNSEKDS